jgi:hypothetical protein
MEVETEGIPGISCNLHPTTVTTPIALRLPLHPTALRRLGRLRNRREDAGR